MGRLGTLPPTHATHATQAQADRTNARNNPRRKTSAAVMVCKAETTWVANAFSRPRAHSWGTGTSWLASSTTRIARASGRAYRLGSPLDTGHAGGPMPPSHAPLACAPDPLRARAC